MPPVAIIQISIDQARARFAGHEHDVLMMELLDIVVVQIEGSSGASR